MNNLCVTNIVISNWNSLQWLGWYMVVGLIDRLKIIFYKQNSLFRLCRRLCLAHPLCREDLFPTKRNVLLAFILSYYK
jgi:hypothetical protein